MNLLVKKSNGHYFNCLWSLFNVNGFYPKGKNK